LWRQKNASDTNIKFKRGQFDEYESNNWMKKIIVENKADKGDLRDLPVYTDPKTGKSFVNVMDLRQRLN